MCRGGEPFKLKFLEKRNCVPDPKPLEVTKLRRYSVGQGFRFSQEKMKAEAFEKV
jgi:hypothetical protein